MPRIPPPPPPQGNQYGLKLKDPTIRQEAYSQYCEHLANGKSKKSWYFEHPEFSCTWQTMEEYMKNEAEFNPLHRQIAESKGYSKWEQIVEDGAVGANPDVNPACLQWL